MARKSKPQIGGKNSKVNHSSRLVFATKKGRPEFLGKPTNATQFDKSGYNFQASLVNAAYDCNPDSMDYRNRISKLYKRCHTELKKKIVFNADDIRKYLDYVRLVSMQAALLGKLLSVYKARNDHQHAFPYIFGTVSYNSNNFQGTFSELMTKFGSSSNIFDQILMEQYYDQLLNIYQHLIQELNTLPDPFGWKYRVFDTIRYFYKDADEAESSYVSFIPPFYHLLRVEDETVVATDTEESWPDLSAEGYLVHFIFLRNHLQQEFPTKWNQVVDCLAQLDVDSNKISDSIDEWERFDISILAALHNARLGNQIVYNQYNGIDSIWNLNDYAGSGFLVKETTVNYQESSDVPLLIDSLFADQVSDYDLIRFASIWEGVDASKNGPVTPEVITALSHVYLNGETNQQGNYGVLAHCGVLSLNASNTAIPSIEGELKAFMVRISNLIQLKSMPPVCLQFYGSNGSVEAYWTTWMWRAGMTAQLTSQQYQDMISLYLDPVE